MNFLIIDDQEPVIEVMKQCLTGLYPESMVDYCFKPETGLNKISHHYDVIFVDYKFDNSDLKGKDILEYLQRKYPRRGVIFMTAFHDKPDVMEAAGLREAGFHGFIPKDKDDSITIKSIQEPIQQKVDAIVEKEKERINQIMTKRTKVDIEKLLDLMEKVMIICNSLVTQNHIVEDVSAGVTLLENGCPEEELYTQICNARTDRNHTYLNVTTGTRVKMMNYNNINEIFKVYDKQGNFVAEDITEKARQLFLTNPADRWSNIKKRHATITKFLKDLDLT